MNGNSLAALLGVATWFGSRFSKKDPRTGKENTPAVMAPDSDADGIDYEGEDREFFWPPGPLFQ